MPLECFMDKTIHFNCIAFKCCLLSYISILSPFILRQMMLQLIFKRTVADIPHPQVNTVEGVYQIDVTEMEYSQNRLSLHQITYVSA